MSATNLVVRLDSEAGLAETEMAEEKMKQTNQEVLEETAFLTSKACRKDLCGEGWSVTPIDASNGSFEITLPAATGLQATPTGAEVRYPMPMGVVSMPSPLFHAQAGRLRATHRFTKVRDSSKMSGSYQERLVVDIVSFGRKRIRIKKRRKKLRLQNGNDMLSVEPLERL